MASDLHEQLEQLMGQDAASLQRKLGEASLAANPRARQGAAPAGVATDLQQLGAKVLNRWQRELFTVFCGNEEADRKERESLFASLGLGDVAVASAIASLLVSAYAMAPAVATVLAALLVKKIISPAGQTFCEFWREQLPPA